MTTEQGEPGTESGREFREKFEALQAEAGELRGLVAEKYGVSADDLKGVPANQIAAKAQELVEARKAERARVLRESLEERGLSGDNLEAALAQLSGGGTQPAPEQKPATNPFASTGSLAGGPPGTLPDPNVRGVSRIRAAVVENRKNH